VKMYGYEFPDPSTEQIAEAVNMGSLARSIKRSILNEEIDRWESGDKQSVGCSARGERYALRMREERKRLLTELAAIDIADRNLP